MWRSVSEEVEHDSVLAGAELHVTARGERDRSLMTAEPNTVSADHEVTALIIHGVADGPKLTTVSPDIRVIIVAVLRCGMTVHIVVKWALKVPRTMIRIARRFRTRCHGQTALSTIIRCRRTGMSDNAELRTRWPEGTRRAVD